MGSDRGTDEGEVRELGHSQPLSGAWTFSPRFFIMIKYRSLDFNLNAEEAIGEAGPFLSFF